MPYSYHSASSGGRVERFEVMSDTYSKAAPPEEKIGVLSFCQSRVFRRITHFRAALAPILVVTALLCVLAGAKWLAHPTPQHRYAAPLLVLLGSLLFVPSIYALADLLGLVSNLADDIAGRRPPIVRDADNYDSQLEVE